METAKHTKQTQIADNYRVRPRALAHRGVVDAAGFLLSLSVMDETEARRRVLRLWVPGVTVHRVTENEETGNGVTLLLLRLPKPARVNCAFVVGMPLVAQYGLLTAMPLSEGEAKRLTAPSGSVVTARGGVARVLSVDNANVEDPADWLDTSAWEWISANSLGLPPVPIPDIAPTQAFDARARLANVTGEAPARQSAIEALRQAMQRGRNDRGEEAANAGQGSRAGRGAGGAGSGSASPLAGWLSRLLGQKKSAGGNMAGAEQSDGEPGRNSLLDAINRLSARMALLAGLSRLIGRHQAEYLKRMMDMFEKGDLDQALRHAIGFSDLEGTNTPPALRTPTPRADLTISPHSTPASGSIGLPTDWTDHLRKLYRQAFERLERAGRVEEAAFVLAELLSAHEEAVSFLEKHDKLELAAEIAEARHLPPGLIVRQWFLAGDIMRAVHIARRTGAFADALQRLEHTDKEKAAQLRWLWAQSLAEMGNYYRAFGLVKFMLQLYWPDEERRAQIWHWLDKSVAMGGVVGAEALAHQFCLLYDLDENAATHAREQALILLESEDEENAPARLAFTRELTSGAELPAAQTLARAAVRACLRDVGMGFQTNLNAADYARLLQFTGDAALKADAPPLPKPIVNQSMYLECLIPAEDVGLLPLLDAAFLPDGRCLVALGEMGVRLLTRDGRIVTHWDTPAHCLVMSDVGNRALVLARRGDLWRIARLDLTTRKLQQWGTARLDAFTSNYDGSLWFVAMDKDFIALDATAADISALWRLPNLEGKIKAIDCSSKQCSFLLFAAGATDDWGRPTPLWTRLEKWTHSLPDLLLRERVEVKPMTEPPDKTQETAANKADTSPKGTDTKPTAWTENRYAQSIAAGGDVFQLKADPAEKVPLSPLSADAPLREDSWLLTLMRPVSPDSAYAPITVYSEQIIGDYALPLPPVTGDKWIWIAIHTPEGIEGRLLSRPQGGLKAKFQLRGATQIRARFTATHLMLADDRGRLLVLELETLNLIRNSRVS